MSHPKEKPMPATLPEPETLTVPAAPRATMNETQLMLQSMASRKLTVQTIDDFAEFDQLESGLPPGLPKRLTEDGVEFAVRYRLVGTKSVATDRYASEMVPVTRGDARFAQVPNEYFNVEGACQVGDCFVFALNAERMEAFKTHQRNKKLGAIINNLDKGTPEVVTGGRNESGRAISTTVEARLTEPKGR